MLLYVTAELNTSVSVTHCLT